jgi:hypothetical protein
MLKNILLTAISLLILGSPQIILAADKQPGSESNAEFVPAEMVPEKTLPSAPAPAKTPPPAMVAEKVIPEKSLPVASMPEKALTAKTEPVVNVPKEVLSAKRTSKTKTASVKATAEKSVAVEIVPHPTPSVNKVTHNIATAQAAAPVHHSIKKTIQQHARDTQKDYRYCLDLKSDAEIAACAYKNR